LERTLLPPDHPQAPKYWMHEAGGKLVPAMKRYLDAYDPEPGDILLIRAYLKQWIDSPVWDGDIGDETRADLAGLRAEVRELRSSGDITMWLDQALGLGIDPL